MTAAPSEWNAPPENNLPDIGKINGESFDEACARLRQSWRLMQGPEPASCLSNGAAFLRYGVYE